MRLWELVYSKPDDHYLRALCLFLEYETKIQSLPISNSDAPSELPFENGINHQSWNMTTLQHATTGNLNGNRPPSPSGQVENLEPVILGTGAALMPITVAIAMVRIATGRAVSKLHIDDCRHPYDLPGRSRADTIKRRLSPHPILWDCPMGNDVPP